MYVLLGIKQMPFSRERSLKHAAKPDPPALSAVSSGKRRGPASGRVAAAAVKVVMARSRGRVGLIQIWEHWGVWVLSLNSPAPPFCPFFTLPPSVPHHLSADSSLWWRICQSFITAHTICHPFPSSTKLLGPVCHPSFHPVTGLS